MDPRVSVSAKALADQYALANRIVAVMNASVAQAATAGTAGLAARADAFGALNDSASALLEIVDGADAPPTAQAIAATSALEQRLTALERAR